MGKVGVHVGNDRNLWFVSNLLIANAASGHWVIMEEWWCNWIMKKNSFTELSIITDRMVTAALIEYVLIVDTIFSQRTACHSVCAIFAYIYIYMDFVIFVFYAFFSSVTVLMFCCQDNQHFYPAACHFTWITLSVLRPFCVSVGGVCACACVCVCMCADWDVYVCKRLWRESKNVCQCDGTVKWWKCENDFISRCLDVCLLVRVHTQCIHCRLCVVCTCIWV